MSSQQGDIFLAIYHCRESAPVEMRKATELPQGAHSYFCPICEGIVHSDKIRYQLVRLALYLPPEEEEQWISSND
jgi:hypothetical protein